VKASISKKPKIIQVLRKNKLKNWGYEIIEK
jgi:hypothetical protein